MNLFSGKPTIEKLKGAAAASPAGARPAGSQEESLYRKIESLREENSYITSQLRETEETADQVLRQIDRKLSEVRGLGDNLKALQQMEGSLKNLDEINVELSELRQLTEKAGEQIRANAGKYDQQSDNLDKAMQDLSAQVESIKTEVAESVAFGEKQLLQLIKGWKSSEDENITEVELSDDSLRKIKKLQRAGKVFSFFALIDTILIVLIVLAVLYIWGIIPNFLG